MTKKDYCWNSRYTYNMVTYFCDLERGHKGCCRFNRILGV